MKRRSTSSNDQTAVKPSDSLTDIPLLNLLNGQDRKKILRDLTEAHYGKGDYIFREGEQAEYFHIVKEGTVKCVKSSADGKECTLKMLRPGDLFCCEAAVFEGGRHPGTAQPMGDVSILRVSKKAYFEMLQHNPDAAIEVIKYLGNRLSEAQEKTKVLALDRADQRLASLLVGLAERTGVKNANRIRLDVRLTRQDMADMIGVTTETAIRLMARLKKARLVSGTANRLVIRDLPRLKALVPV